MGFLENRILLSPTVVSGLKWKDKRGIPNHEIPMGTVIHELTHRKQMSWLKGFAWLFLNIPGVDRFTIERWARQNEAAAVESLSEIYAEIRTHGI